MRIRDYKIIFTLTSLLLTFVITMDTFGKEKQPGDIRSNKVVATVNGQEISRTQLGDFLIDAYGDMALDFMIKKKLVDQEAKKHGVQVTKAEIEERLKSDVDAQINMTMKQYRLKTTEDLELELFKGGLTVDKLRKNISESLKNQIEIHLMVEKILLKDITYTEDDLRAAYDDIYGEKIHAKQIVLKTRKKAEEVLLKLGGGAEFAKLAEKESIDRASAARGGEMLPFGLNSAIGKAVASLKKGQMSDIIETGYGYHIIQVIDRTPAGDKSFDEVRSRLERIVKREKLNQKIQPWLLSLFEGAKVDINM